MIQALARKYFELLSEHFPVMTGSDEFYFLPRIESRQSGVESLDPDLMGQLSREIRAIRIELEKIRPGSVEDKIDQRMLGISLNNFIFHFDEFPLWRRDPTLYLKVLIMGLDRSRFTEDTNEGWVELRLESIARLLDQAGVNLTHVTELHRELGLEMIRDVSKFLSDLRRDEFFRKRAFNSGLRKLNEALEQLKEHLECLEAREEAWVGKEVLERILIENFCLPCPLDAARENIEHEIAETEKNLKREARKIDARKSPDDVIQGIPTPHFHSRSILPAYRREVRNLKEFIIEKGLFDLGNDPGVDVEFTPNAMRSIRSAAAYAAPLSLDAGPGRYYILPLPRRPHTRDQIKRLRFIHRQIRFVSAHETYPGHHLIDMARLSNPNPIRRAIELPLVYEGWACYSESIIVRAGYFIDPSGAILLDKRRWLRAMRGLADLAFQSGAASLEQAAEILVSMGLTSESALSTIRRFALNPGYQMCYTLGTKGFHELFDEFAGNFTGREFHEKILEGGEIPFIEARERLEYLEGKE